MKNLLVGVIICALGVLLSLGLFFEYPWPDTPESRGAMALELFGFGLTTVIVSGAAVIFDHLRRKIEDRQHKVEQTAQKKAARRQRLEVLLREFTETYNGIKFVRRELRNAFETYENGGFVIERERYEKLLHDLNRGQLQLETFRRILESRPEYLSFFGSEAVEWMSKAESYLRNVTKEYERRSLKQQDSNGSMLCAYANAAVIEFAVSSEVSDKCHPVHTKFFDPLERIFIGFYQNIEGQD